MQFFVFLTKAAELITLDLAEKTPSSEHGAKTCFYIIGEKQKQSSIPNRKIIAKSGKIITRKLQ